MLCPFYFITEISEYLIPCPSKLWHFSRPSLNCHFCCLAPVFQSERALILSAGLTTWLTLGKPFSLTFLYVRSQVHNTPPVVVIVNITDNGLLAGCGKCQLLICTGLHCMRCVEHMYTKAPAFPRPGSSCVTVIVILQSTVTPPTAPFLALQCSLPNLLVVPCRHSLQATFSWPGYVLPLCGTLVVPAWLATSVPSDPCSPRGGPSPCGAAQPFLPFTALLYVIFLRRLCVCIRRVASIRIQAQDGIFVSFMNCSTSAQNKVLNKYFWSEWMDGCVHSLAEESQYSGTVLWWACTGCAREP